MMDTDEELMSLEEVANLLDLTEESLILHVHEGTVPAVKEGPFWRFRRGDIVSWQREQGVETEPGLKVLLVEDDPMQRQLVAEWLLQLGLDVTSLADGQSALEYLQQQPVDLLLTDLNLPHLSGADLIEAARELNAVDKVWVMTSYSESSMMQKAFNTRQVTALRKPLSRRVVEELLARECASVRDRAR